MTFALEFKGVKKRYKRRYALDGLDLAVETGELLGLVGSNGAGKTTTLSVAAGLVRASSGDVHVLGEGPFDAAKSAGRLSLIPQDSSFPLHAAVGDLLKFYAELQGMKARDARKSAEEALEWVNLSDRAQSSIHSLSHGMRRRVAIAQAFLGHPELVLLDEPMSGLDPREVVNVRKMLIGRKGRQTIIISSHNLAEIERICDQVAFIENGKTVRHDSVDRLTQRTDAVTYYLEYDPGSIDELAGQLPEARFAVNSNSHSAGFWPGGCESVLCCEYEGDTMSAAKMNQTVLAYLLKAGIGVVEVRCGRELESTYLETSDATKVE